MEETAVIVDINGPVATLVLNRPQQRNALNPAMLEKLVEALEKLQRSSGVRVLMLRGAGDKAFSAGYDLTAIPADIAAKASSATPIHNPVERCMASLANFPCPTIAMINGAAFGAGLELAVCCDLRVACREARMGMPPAKLGLVYMADGLQRFINVAGAANTKEIFLTGRSYDSSRAKELGLIHYVVERTELEGFTRALAEEIAANAPLALAGLKEVINRVSARSLTDQERTACEELVMRCFASRDFREARQAFVEKRQPCFKGE